MRGLFIVVGFFGLCLARPHVARSQARDSASIKARPNNVAATSPSCCSIVRIDPKRSIVTARETATGFTFRFEVKGRRLLGTLKVGQPVWADFASKTVKVKAADATPCCAIVTLETP